jgi:opacity protein-like surface antigen
LKRTLFLPVVLGTLAAFSPSAHGQTAAPTATRLADLQVGGGFVWAHSDYVPNDIGGFGLYADYDIRGHYGIEADFHQVRDPNADRLVPGNHFSERTYEIGGRYVRRYDRGRFAPYGKVLFGRGVVNFVAHQRFVPGGLETYVDNIGYNMVSLGGGLDYRLTERINLRGDFEYQHLFAHDSELPNGLSPHMFTIGAAYHFPARGPTK